MSDHHFEYSRTSRAVCCGPPPCRGSTIVIGALRYGRTIPTEFGETVEWRHWGCVTPTIFAKLSRVDLDAVPGFSKLRPEDQTKIRQAINLRHVDTSGTPPQGRPLNAVQDAASVLSQRKRRAAFEQSTSSSSSHPLATQRQPVSLHRSVVPIASQQAEDDSTPPQDDDPIDELYCTLNTSIVGVQYYNGMVGSGEQVQLIREPTNRYDRNAIQVKNIANVQVGHIPRQVAAKLSPMLDRKLVAVEGVVLEGNLRASKYSLSLAIKIYGRMDLRAQLEPALTWATPGQRGFEPEVSTSRSKKTTKAASTALSAPQAVARPSKSAYAVHSQAQTAAQREANRKLQEDLQKAAELKQILDNLEKVDDEGRRNSLLDQLLSTDDVLTLPVHPSPPGIKSGDLKVNLLKHQSQALQWCIERENPVLPKSEDEKPVQFWQLRKNGTKTYYYNLATKTPQEAAPELGRGALCADSMGLGKTLTMIALILATKKDVPQNFSSSTLIVVPLSILSNWEKQIDDHCSEGALSYCIYYGAGRALTAAEMQEFDVVITTYQTVVQESPSASKPEGHIKKKKKVDRDLFDVKWKRVILDEGHQIRNANTKMAKAVSALNAQRRWILTGTPIINSPKDLGSLLTFLKICRPLDQDDFFKRLVLRPLTVNDPSGAELLRGIMSHICIRRTKEMQDSEGHHLVPLPPVDMTLVPVALSPGVRELYDAVEEVSRRKLEGLLTASGGTGMQVGALSMLTRLRQLALHPALIPSDYLTQLEQTEQSDELPQGVINITPADRIRLQDVLAQAIEDNEECPICFNILNDPRITSCTHYYCLPCITEAINRDPRCPMDRRPIGIGDLIEPLPPAELTQLPIAQEADDDDYEADDLRNGSSAKIDQLVHLLKLTPSTDKSLVFSQFTSFLDKIGEALEVEGVSFVRFDGKMSAKRREETIRQFSVPIVGDTEAVQSDRAARNCRHERDSAGNIEDKNNDSDFVMEDGDDDDFLDDDDGAVWSKKGNGKERSQRKGKSKAKAKSMNNPESTFSGKNPKVMLISLKAGALGLNLTVANNVYLMDPWWQEGIESQAIDRCNRIGQTKPVHVYQLIAEDTVESKVIEIQEKKKALIKAAFSGIKNKETPREKRQARLQEIIELFGIKNRTVQAV